MEAWEFLTSSQAYKLTSSSRSRRGPQALLSTSRMQQVVAFMRALHRPARFSIAAAGAVLFASAQVAQAQTPSLQYPATRRVDQVDEYHGNRIADPYRWLEDVGSADTRGWIDAQNALTRSYLDAITDRPRIRAT